MRSWRITGYVLLVVCSLLSADLFAGNWRETCAKWISQILSSDLQSVQTDSFQSWSGEINEEFLIKSREQKWRLERLFAEDSDVEFSAVAEAVRLHSNKDNSVNILLDDRHVLSVDQDQVGDMWMIEVEELGAVGGFSGSRWQQHENSIAQVMRGLFLAAGDRLAKDPSIMRTEINVNDIVEPQLWNWLVSIGFKPERWSLGNGFEAGGSLTMQIVVR